jgi:integrating conjugative element membrane protein (TIGR03747 family)
MPSPSNTSPPAPVRPRGLAGLITLPFHLFGILCGSLLLSILIEWMGIHFLWPQDSWHHAQRMTDYELNQLSSDFTRSLLFQQPIRTAQHLVDWTYEHLFIRIRLLDRIETASATQPNSRGAGFPDLLRSAGTSLQPYALAAGYTVLTFLVRLLVLCLTLPLFALAWLVGLVDGLARRDLRRFGAGRESGFVYHRARATLMPLAVLPWVLYLAMPVSVHPLWIILPGAILLSIAVNLTAATFKKYL